MMRCVKDFFKNLSLNKGTLAIIVILSALFVLLDIGNTSNIILRSGSTVSLADCLVSSANTFVFSLCYIPLFLFLVQHIIKYDFFTNIVLKSENRHDLWNKMWIQMFLTSLLTMIFLLVLTCLVGSFYSTELINWASKSSYYFSVNHTVNSNINFQQVLVRFLAVSVLRGIVTGSVFQLILWIWNKSIFSWIGIITFNCFSIVFPNLSFLYGGNVTIKYSSWIGSNHYAGLLSVFLFLIAVYLFGYIMSSRKEFFNAKR